MAKESCAYLLEDGGIRRWHENVARGSRVTADVYLRTLGSKDHQKHVEKVLSEEYS